MATPNSIPVPQSAADITPYWVQLVLQRDLPDVIITDVDVKGSIGQGEGYLSDIVAFNAVGTKNGKTERYSLVAKLTEFAGQLSAYEGLSKAFQIKMETTEVKFYSTIVPDLLAMSSQRPEDKQNEDRPPADSWVLPKCYFAATDPSSMVSVRVMENLKSQGFSVKVYPQNLSRDEMMVAVGALAQVHGLSHRLELRLGKPLPEKYGWMFSGVDPTTLAAVESFVNSTYLESVELFAANFPDHPELVARLEKINAQTVLTDALQNCTRPKVLNHGDFYCNNIMIKYEGEVPVEAKLVDWQLTAYLPPTCDLAYLFLCCADWDTFHNHRDAILAHYHQELQKTLGPNETSGLWTYTLEQLKADFKTDCLHALCNVFIAKAKRPPASLLQMVQQINDWGVI